VIVLEPAPSDTLVLGIDLTATPATAAMVALATAADSLIAGSMTEMVAICDATGAVTMMNRAMAAAAGRPETSRAASALGMWKHRHLDGTPVARRDLPLSRALRGEAVTDEELLVTWQRSHRIVVVNARSLSDSNGHLLGAAVVMRDITQQREAEAKVAFHALHDGVTGLASRPLFIEHLKRALRSCGAASVVDGRVRDQHRRLRVDQRPVRA